jgi:hypothetical protein
MSDHRRGTIEWRTAHVSVVPSPMGTDGYRLTALGDF